MKTLSSHLCLLFLLACSPATPHPTTGASSAPATSTSVTVVPEASASPSSSAVPIVEVPGGAVKAPVFSDDDCKEDKECLGIGTCHPDKCVAAAKAGSMKPGTMCTMDCRGGTLDCNFNHCGCAKNPAGKQKCAMLPGPISGH